MDCGHEDGAPAEFVKIGFTTDPKVSNRLRALQTGNPRNLIIQSVLDMKDAEMARSLERIIHWNLDKHRVSGEWFKCNQEVKHFVSNIMPHLGFHFLGNPEEIFLQVEASS